MKTNLRIVSGIILLLATLGFALLPVTLERKIKQLNNEVDSLNSRIIGLEKRISKTHAYLRESTVLSQHIELLQILRREEMIAEKMNKLMLHKYKALQIAYNITDKNRIIKSFSPPPIDFKTPEEFQARFDKYMGIGIASAEKCYEKMESSNIELNSLEYKKRIMWITLISLQGVGLFFGIISKRNV